MSVVDLGVNNISHSQSIDHRDPSISINDSSSRINRNGSSLSLTKSSEEVLDKMVKKDLSTQNQNTQQMSMDDLRKQLLETRERRMQADIAKLENNKSVEEINDDETDDLTQQLRGQVNSALRGCHESLSNMIQSLNQNKQSLSLANYAYMLDRCINLLDQEQEDISSYEDYLEFTTKDMVKQLGSPLIADQVCRSLEELTQMHSDHFTVDFNDSSFSMKHLQSSLARLGDLIGTTIGLEVSMNTDQDQEVAKALAESFQNEQLDQWRQLVQDGVLSRSEAEAMAGQSLN